MQQLGIFQKAYDFYKHIYENLRTIPKRDRYTWGERCETLTLDALTLAAKAGYLQRHEKNLMMRDLSFRIDLLKIFLRLGHELRIIDDTKYIARENELIEIGKMIGGLIKSISS